MRWSISIRSAAGGLTIRSAPSMRRARSWMARRSTEGSAAVPRGISNNDHREAADIRHGRIGVTDERNARLTRAGPADSAQHSEPSLVHAHRGGRAMSDAKLDLLQGT